MRSASERGRRQAGVLLAAGWALTGCGSQPAVAPSTEGIVSAALQDSTESQRKALADGVVTLAEYQAALDAGHAGKIYELAGDEGYTLAELAAEVARQSGKPVGFVNLPQADYAKALEGFGLPAGFAAVLADSDARAGEGALFDDSRTLSHLIGRATTPMAATVRDALA